MKVAAKSED